MKHFGLIVVNKPSGITSRDAVNIVQKVARPAKVGHAGTLDPLASGVLVLCVGPATRLIEFVQKMTKIYHATFLLGRHSDTEDINGTVEEISDPRVPSLDALRDAANRLTGPILQRPPAYSALKVAGKRAYDLARAGKPFELAERPVHIHRLELLRYEYPELEMRIHCSSGTYVRSLGRDLAQAVGSAAVMSALVREAVGPFTLDKAVTPDRLTPLRWAEHLLPARSAVPDLPTVTVGSSELQKLRQGLPIRVQRDALEPVAGAPVEASSALWAAVDHQGRLVALLVRRGPEELGPRCNFSA